MHLASAPKSHSVCLAEGRQEQKQREQVAGSRHWDGQRRLQLGSRYVYKGIDRAGFTDDPVVECEGKEFRKFWVED